MLLIGANEADIPLIQALAQEIWRAHYPGIISEAQIDYMLHWRYSTAALQEQMAEGQTFLLLKTSPDAPASGFIGISREAEAGAYFMHKFYLATSLQGRGVGAAAFQALTAHLPDMRTLRLTVNRQNFKSVNFYFKCGFRIEGCLDVPIGNGYEMNDFMMLWKRADRD